MVLLDAATGGYAMALVQSIVALAGVCALAVLLLRMASSRGLGRAPKGRAMEMVERMAIDHRASICIVRVGERRLLLGVADGDAPRLLAELDPNAAPADPATTPTPTPAASTRSFRELVSSLGSKSDRVSE